MKTKLIIEIETVDMKDVKVVPEEGKSESDYSDMELECFRDEYADNLHKEIVKRATEYFTDSDKFEEEFVNDPDECGVDGYDSFEEYGVKIKVNADKEK